MTDLSLNVSKQAVYDLVRRQGNKPSGSSFGDAKRSGRPPSVRTPELIAKVRKKLSRNPTASIYGLAKQFQVGHKTMRRLINVDLGMKLLRKVRCQELKPETMQKRIDRSKIFLRRLAAFKWDRAVYSDGKLFSVEQRLTRS